MIHGGLIYHLGVDPSLVLDFSSNVNPYGPPEGAIQAAQRALLNAKFYPDPSHTMLKEAFSGWIGVDPRMVCFGNGASELIGAIIMAEKPKRLLAFTPTFGEYQAWAKRLAVPFEGIPLRGHAFDPPIEDLRRSIRPGDMFVICQPNNPTGRAYSGKEIRAITSACEDGRALLLVDECFINLTSPPAESIIRDGTVPENSLILRAFTKDFSAPGLRVGAAVASPERIVRIRQCLQPWPINCAGEAFARWCSLNPEPFLSDSRNNLASERQILSDSLEGLGFEVLPSQSNFLLCVAPLDSAILGARLRPHRILIRTCGSFQLGNRYVRLAVKDRASNLAFIKALKEVLKGG